jgi:hypothetical protein
LDEVDFFDESLSSLSRLRWVIFKSLETWMSHCQVSQDLDESLSSDSSKWRWSSEDPYTPGLWQVCYSSGQVSFHQHVSKLCPRRSDRANAKWVWHWHGIPKLPPPPHLHHPLNSATLDRKPLPTRPRRGQSRTWWHLVFSENTKTRSPAGPRSPVPVSGSVIVRPPRTGVFRSTQLWDHPGQGFWEQGNSVIVRRTRTGFFCVVYMNRWSEIY